MSDSSQQFVEKYVMLLTFNDTYTYLITDTVLMQ